MSQWKFFNKDPSTHKPKVAGSRILPPFYIIGILTRKGYKIISKRYSARKS